MRLYDIRRIVAESRLSKLGKLLFRQILCSRMLFSTHEALHNLWLLWLTQMSLKKRSTDKLHKLRTSRKLRRPEET